MARVVVDEGWRIALEGEELDYLENRLGPEIVDDAKRFCPVGLGPPMQDDIPGFLRDSITHYMEGRQLIIEAGADYASAVEFGHLVFHPSDGKTGPEHVPAQPFLRPAVYKQRELG